MFVLTGNTYGPSRLGTGIASLRLLYGTHLAKKNKCTCTDTSADSCARTNQIQSSPGVMLDPSNVVENREEKENETEKENGVQRETYKERKNRNERKGQGTSSRRSRDHRKRKKEREKQEKSLQHFRNSYVSHDTFSVLKSEVSCRVSPYTGGDTSRGS
jgi:hypothetical protein